MNTFIVVSLEVLNETLLKKHLSEILSMSSHKIGFGAKSTFLESSNVMVLLTLVVHILAHQS